MRECQVLPTTMSREVQAMFSLLLIMATCAATGFAHVPPPPLLPNFPNIPGLLPPRIPSSLPPGIPGLLPPGIPGLLPPGIPGLLPPGIPGLRPPVDPAEIAKCWSSLQGIPGCAQEIITTIFTGKFALGPACCKAIVEVDEKCLPKLFPLFPSVSALLKHNCAQQNVAPPNAFGSKH